MAETALLLSRKAADFLAAKGVQNARLDADLLLAHALGVTRLQLYLQFDRPLREDELERYRGLVRRRLRREPVQYILGSAHFRELELAVDPRVLIPRPETEELVGLVLEWAWAQVGGKPGRKQPPADEEGEIAGSRDAETGAANRRLVALDLGTGSGAIALSLLREGPFERVVATDVSAGALEVAGANAARLGLGERVELREGSLWQALAGERTFDVVASNPPYVAERERSQLAPEVREWEPAPALFAGDAGFDVLGPLIAGAASHLRPGGLLALEIGASQAEGTLRLLEAADAFEGLRIARDLAGRQRVALATRRIGQDGESEHAERRRESLAHGAERREHA